MKYGGLDISDFSRLFDDALADNPEEHHLYQNAS